MNNVLNNEEELNARIYTFPTSAIKLNNKKINYFEFLSSYYDENCSNAVKRIYERIDLNKINSFIDTVPYLSELQIEFFKTYIHSRYEKIIKHSYDNLI